MAVEAHRFARSLAQTDQIISRYMEDLAGTQQLALAGCLRTISDTALLGELLSSLAGQQALEDAILHELRVIVTVPQVQSYYEHRFGGATLGGGNAGVANAVRYAINKPFEVARTVRHFLLKVALLPAAAAYPPLAGPEYLDYSPSFRYWAYEISGVLFFFLLVGSTFPIFRAHRNWPRDYGLVIWTMTQFAHQMHFMFLAGVNSFADLYELVDLTANVCCLTALILNICNGDEPIDVEGLLFTVGGSGYSCSDYPVTVPLAGTDVLAIGALLKGLLLFRLMRLHHKYGPLLLMVLKMCMDMLMWLVFSAVPIIAFGAALNIVYTRTSTTTRQRQYTTTPATTTRTWSSIRTASR